MNHKRVGIFVSLVIISCVLAVTYYLASANDDYEICPTMESPAHFRTDIRTGECEFVNRKSCYVQDSAEYAAGCNISTEEKVALLKKSEEFEAAIAECTKYCEREKRTFFCASIIPGLMDDISCSQILNCGPISCA